MISGNLLEFLTEIFNCKNEKFNELELLKDFVFSMKSIYLNFNQKF